MITWLGHAGFKIRCKDPSSGEQKVIFIDPWLSCPTCPESEKTQEKADLILVTHGHFDHCSDSPELSSKTGAPIVAVRELAEVLSAKGAAQITGMNKGGTLEYDYCNVTMVSADHSGGGPDGVYAGAPTGFVVSFKDGSPSIYHGGDTNVFSDMKIISDLYQPQIALLPIGGHFTMSPREAAYALNQFLLSVKTVVPMHYGTFPLLKGNPEQLATELQNTFPNTSRGPLKIENLNIGTEVELSSIV